MAVAKVRLNAQIARNLGQATINEMCRRLYALDCQVCGRRLGPDRPGVSVDAFGTEERPAEGTTAWLHHMGCKRPGWHDCASVEDVTMPRHQYLSSRTFSMVLSHSPFPDVVDPVPIVMVNPSMEAVRLCRTGSARWRVDTEGIFRESFAMARGSVGSLLPVVKSGVLERTRMRPDNGVSFRLRVGGQAWPVSAPRRVAEVILAQRGAAVLVTAAMDPHSVQGDGFSAHDLVAFIASGECAMGWTPLALARASCDQSVRRRA